ncbi:MAG: hypothetical protein ISS19_12800 [Bacteroidales bacterium]|nr:hypothetical protein [Bacteroidales bacterium]
MIKRISIALLLSLIVFSTARSSDLFPQVEGWKLITNDRVYVPGNLWDLINGAADAYLSYDFQDLHLADYENKDGVSIRVELYRHSTYNNAYGIYTTERSPEYEFIDIGLEGYQEEGILNFQCGYYYIKMSCFDEADGLSKEMLKIGKKVQEHLNQEVFWPYVLRYFPATEAHTDHYIAENFLGFDFLHSAFIAPYSIDGTEFQLFIITTGDPGTVQEMLTKYFAFTKQEIEVKDGRYTVRDPYNGDIEVLLKGEFLTGIVDCDDPDLSAKLLEQLNQDLGK